MVNFLISNGATPNAADRKGRTPLHTFIDNDWFEGAKALVEGGASFDSVYNKGKSLFDYAKKLKRVRFVDFFTERRNACFLAEENGRAGARNSVPPRPQSQPIFPVYVPEEEQGAPHSHPDQIFYQPPRQVYPEVVAPPPSFPMEEEPWDEEQEAENLRLVLELSGNQQQPAVPAEEERREEVRRNEEQEAQDLQLAIMLAEEEGEELEEEPGPVVRGERNNLQGVPVDAETMLQIALAESLNQNPQREAEQPPVVREIENPQHVAPVGAGPQPVPQPIPHFGDGFFQQNPWAVVPPPVPQAQPPFNPQASAPPFQAPPPHQAPAPPGSQLSEAMLHWLDVQQGQPNHRGVVHHGSVSSGTSFARSSMVHQRP